MAEIISIFSKQKISNSHAENEEGSKNATKHAPQNAPADFFTRIAMENKQNKDRLRKERAQANRNVMRSYRIK